MATLKKYKTGSKSDYEVKPSDRIKSGVQSGDSDAELEILVPIQEHPEMPDLVRAVDPDTGWRGWVKYVPPVPVPKPVPKPEPLTKKQTDRQTFKDLYQSFIRKERLVQQGILPDTVLDPLRKELASKYSDEMLDEVKVD